MIDEGTLNSLLGRFRDQRQLERDYLLTLLLHEISSGLAKELVFKGGTALKFFYGLNRFSEDLDFSYCGIADALARKSLDEKIGSALKGLENQYPLEWHERRYGKKDDAILDANHNIRVKGPLNHKSGELQNIKIDISLRNDLLLEPKLMYFSPVYPDITTFSVFVMGIGEILAEKIASIIERPKMRDIYDVYYLLRFRNIAYDKRLVTEKMERRGESFSAENLAERVRSASDKMKWRSELAYLVVDLPDGAEVWSYLSEALGLGKG